jgi:predicted nucleotidyltransferase
MTFLDVSTAVDLHPVATVLAELHERAQAQGVELMVVGAVARDILIRHVVGAPPERATADVDVAAAVSTWEELHLVTQTMQPARNSVHTFLVRNMEVDVIPFGGIESAQRTITWPNDHMMQVLGFQEAMRSALSVMLPGGLVVAVASLPAQSLLKLFAWKDRRYLDRRDAIDLKTILHAYHQGSYLDELYDNYLGLLEKHDFDPRLAGAERMGKEAILLIAPADRGVVADLLFGEELSSLIVSDMGGQPGENRALLSAYIEGCNLMSI